MRLDDDWPDRDDHEVEVRCPVESEACWLGEDADPAGPVWRAAVEGAATVEVRVVDSATSTVVAERLVEPDYRIVERPHGILCGGPAAAVVSLADP
ncbi:hypothetical protein [Oerskovia flava]|uniref:hypothetical protein n=1 Tax=Oerskovia flava TaxID=2986422 RepID=UPI00223FE8E1|nr:hypothetical protein [Oerskovia sp. JB1-3-2]